MSEQPENMRDEQDQHQDQPNTSHRRQGMRFFVKLDDLPFAPTYMQPLSLHRHEETEDTVFMERFDKKTGICVDNPVLIRFTGIGGDESYKEIDEEEANRLIEMWTLDEAEK